MVEHWLRIQVNGYLGSSYGQDIKALLNLPLGSREADAFLQKMREDIPALGVYPSASINLYAVDTPPDKKELFIEIAGQSIAIPGV